MTIDYATQEIVARPGRYYRWTRYLISIGLLMGYGSLFFRDGFITWPRERERVLELRRQGRTSEIKEKEHSELDISLNRAIGLVVPPLGLALLVWTLYRSRGRYRLAGHTLHVPGHPPVPLEAIRQIDKTLWDRKGIAYIDYELPVDSSGESPAGESPATGQLKLDDFVYDQEQTDAILKRIENIVAPEASDAAEEEAGSAGDGEMEGAGSAGNEVEDAQASDASVASRDARDE